MGSSTITSFRQFFNTVNSGDDKQQQQNDFLGTVEDAGEDSIVISGSHDSSGSRGSSSGSAETPVAWGSPSSCGGDNGWIVKTTKSTSSSSKVGGGGKEETEKARGIEVEVDLQEYDMLFNGDTTATVTSANHHHHHHLQQEQQTAQATTEATNTNSNNNLSNASLVAELDPTHNDTMATAPYFIVYDDAPDDEQEYLMYRKYFKDEELVSWLADDKTQNSNSARGDGYCVNNNNNTSTTSSSSNNAKENNARALSGDGSNCSGKGGSFEAHKLTEALIQAQQKQLDNNVDDESEEVLNLLHEWMDMTSSDNNGELIADKYRRELLFAGGHYVLLQVILPQIMNNSDISNRHNHSQLVVASWMCLLHVALLPDARRTILSLGYSNSNNATTTYCDYGRMHCDATTPTVFKIILKGMQRFPAHVTLQLTGCGLLAKLLTIESSHEQEGGKDGRELLHEQKVIAEYGLKWIQLGEGVHCIISAIKTFPNHLKLHRFACWALERLSHCLLVLANVSENNVNKNNEGRDKNCSNNNNRQHGELQPNTSMASLVVDVICKLTDVIELYDDEPLVTEYAFPAYENLIYLVNTLDAVTYCGCSSNDRNASWWRDCRRPIGNNDEGTSSNTKREAAEEGDGYFSLSSSHHYSSELVGYSF